jgi:hypothetical protein
MATTSADVATLQARLDQLQAARDSGVLLIVHGETRTEFRSLDQMNLIIADLKRQIDKLNGVKRSRVNYIEQRNKGFGHSPLSASRLRNEFK